MKLTNKNNLSLPLAVLLSHSDYDYNSDPKTISATTLLKPIRSIILALQNPDLDKSVDLSDLIPSVFGSAVHAFAESGWNKLSTVRTAMDALSVSLDVSKRVIINPETVLQGQIPIYIERRSSRPLNGWNISGKFDGCVDGKLFDYKITSVWGFIFDSNSEDYVLQGSIYRWLNPTIVTADHISIERVFSDWSSTSARNDRKYPQLRVQSTDYPLMSLSATESWISNRLAAINSGILPTCTDDELWAKPDVWKYYKKKGAKRATKNYTNSSEAYTRLSTDGDTGEVIHFPGKINRCKYCSVCEICTQAKELIAAGRLEL